MGKKGVAGKKVKSKQESAEVAPAEAQTAQDAPAACIKCGRTATRFYLCQMCPADCRKPYAACDRCDLDDLVKKAAKKKLKLEEQNRIFPHGTCVFRHLQKDRWLVINKYFPMLAEPSPAPAGAARRAPCAAPHLAAAELASDDEGNAEAGAAAETAGSPSGQRVPEKEQQAPLEEEQQEAPSAAQEAPFGFFNPLGLTKDVGVETFERCRESELKNGLVAMHATMGYVKLECFPSYLEAVAQSQATLEEEAVRDVEYMRSRLREVGGEDSEAEVGGEDAEAEAEALAPPSSSAPPSQRPELQRQTKRNEISTEGRSTDAAATTSSTATSAATGASEERRAPGASEERAHRETEPFADGFMETLPSVALYRNLLAQMEFEESVVTAQREAEEREEDRRWEAAQNHVCFRTQHCYYYYYNFGWCMRGEFCSYIHAGPDEVRY